MTAMMWIAAILYLFLYNILQVTHTDDKYGNAVSLLGYCKIFITFIKYIPQVYWNYIRKSTLGWSIFNM